MPSEIAGSAAVAVPAVLSGVAGSAAVKDSSPVLSRGKRVRALEVIGSLHLGGSSKPTPFAEGTNAIRMKSLHDRVETQPFSFFIRRYTRPSFWETKRATTS
mmetsp:Transcript_14132/g.27436  ORF Transcript_14132/g.27436 Transcript_14132/m.27436 type:complete len:102 (-) Transcript_14132:854-1159(-)